MKEIRGNWRKGGKAYKAGIVLGFLLLSTFLIYFVIMAWKTNIIFGLVLLGVVLVVTLVAGLAYLTLLGIVWSVIHGAIKGAVSEVKNFLKEMKG
jgi:hypothetical protein